jgi:hypothetical protein
MNTIKAKGRVVNKNEVEAQFVGKNLTIVGGIGWIRYSRRWSTLATTLTRALSAGTFRSSTSPGEEDRRSECGPPDEGKK